MKQKNFTEGIALGAFITILIIFVFGLLFDMRFFGDDSDDYIQTILTSVAALGAAYLALLGIRHQIQQNNDIEEQRRLQSLRAARAGLPLALSNLVNNSQIFLGYIIDGKAVTLEEITKSISNISILETLTKCIEFSDPQSADRLSQIIRYIQLVIARFEPKYFSGAYPIHEQDWIKVDHGRTSYFLDWATLIAICNSSFAFARGSACKIKPQIGKEEIRNAILTAKIFIEDFPRIEELIEIRSQDGRLDRDFSRP